MDIRKTLKNIKRCIDKIRLDLNRDKNLDKSDFSLDEIDKDTWEQLNRPDIVNTIGIDRQPESNIDLDLTVIIPVYNTEKYLEQAVLQVQSCRYNYEVIVIDDGSTDDSWEIMQLMKKNYDNYNQTKGNLVIKHKNNGGLSSVRNMGLNLARGKYIMFLDSDDFLTDCTVDAMMDAAYMNDADIVMTDYEKLFGEKLVQQGLGIKDRVIHNNSEDKLKQLFKYPGYGCMKIYKRQLFDKVQFPEQYMYEDTIIHMLIYPQCKTFVALSRIGYIYRQGEQSLTHSTKTQIKRLDAARIMSQISKMMKKAGIETNEAMQAEIDYTLCQILTERLKYMSDKQLRAVYKYVRTYISNMTYREWLKSRVKFVEV